MDKIRFDEIIKYLEIHGIKIPEKVKTNLGEFYPRNYLKSAINKATSDRTAIENRATDDEILDWAKRWDLKESLVDLRAMFEDAQSRAGL